MRSEWFEQPKYETFFERFLIRTTSRPPGFDGSVPHNVRLAKRRRFVGSLPSALTWGFLRGAETYGIAL